MDLSNDNDIFVRRKVVATYSSRTRDITNTAYNECPDISN